jgi:hypothetical protein
MKVIGHHHKFVEQKAALLAVLLHDVNQEPGRAVRLKDGLSSIGNGSDKKCANFLGSKLYTSGPGLKPKDCKGAGDAALKGRSSTANLRP